jgi:translation initiation factor IF-2
LTKTVKFNVKNLQIAGAINLGGLKEKLARKKEAEEEEIRQQALAKKAAKEKEKQEKVAKVEKKKEAKAAPEKPKQKKKESPKKEHILAPKVEEKELPVTKVEEVLPPPPAREEGEIAPTPAPVAELHEVKAPAAAAPMPSPQRSPAAMPRTQEFQRRPDHGRAPPRREEFGGRPRFQPLTSVSPKQHAPQGQKELVRPVIKAPPAYTGEGYRRTPQGSSQSRGPSQPGGPYREGQARPYREGQARPAGPYQSRGPSQPGGPYQSRGPSTQARPYGPPRSTGPYQSRPYGPPRTGEGGRPPYGQSRPYGPPRRPTGTLPPAKKEFPTRDRTFIAPKKMSPGEEAKFGKGKEKTTRKVEEKVFDARLRHGFISGDEEEGGWRGRRRPKNRVVAIEQEIIRPAKIKVRLPITIKDLAQEMKLKASELISKLFVQGVIVTLNDLLSDPVVVQLLGHDFNCEITIDTSEEERIRISEIKVREEIAKEETSTLVTRPPVIAFMGHVDHGKTSLVDAIRHSNLAAKEVGAITQHIGAFQCVTTHGPITILDTPGHEAFTLMRERGASITDIVVLVIAGDEGIQEQTIEAINQAQAAKATIVVAITKSDKPTFDAERVYRQLADHHLLPEVWGGQTVAVSCSAVAKEGISELLEMIALQAEVLELKANPLARARGAVIESKMEQGLGASATLLVQNGTLHIGDSLVFGAEWAKVKTMHDEAGHSQVEAAPSAAVRITGLSGLPQAGEEFIVVKSEKEAKEIAAVRQEGRRVAGFQKKRTTTESFMESSAKVAKKVFTLILRADVQGSLEALVKALEKIQSEKVEINIISQGIGEISESDVELAATSRGTILGFHSSIEAHAEQLIRETGVRVILHNIIYHAVDEVRALMKGLLEKIPQEEERGKLEVKAIFRASQLGVIAGGIVTDGSISRSNLIRVRRGDKIVWKGGITSLKRGKEDAREVQKGIECGVLLAGFNEAAPGDILEAYEITYLTQEL